MKKIILLVDNVQDFLEVQSKLLEQAGYQVLQAPTLEEAERKLKEKHIHLAIFDIRMLDEDDEQDISGLLLAQKEEYRSVPKIILTAYPSYEYVREALGLAPDGRPPAVNFLDKDEGPEALIQAVERTFAQHLRLNWNLNIHWDPREQLSFLHLAKLLQPDLPNDTLVQRAEELEDLFRRLFYDYQQIRIGRLLWHDGRRFCLPVLAQSPQGATAPRILVCGERNRLEQELRRMRELAPETLHETKLVNAMETMHFGAAAYVLPDTDVETVQTLKELFQKDKERPLKAAFDHLLKGVLIAWHQRGQMVETGCDLMTFYRRQVGLEENGLSRTEMEGRIEALIRTVRPLSAVEIRRGDETITFQFPNQESLSCHDPVATVHTLLEGYDKSVVCRISPGRLTADNVLVDKNQQTWLTDFAHAGPAPQWWDFVCLEAIVRFNLSQAPDLLAWQEFEECLVTPSRLHDRLSVKDVVADLRTSVVLIEQIRRQAGSEAGPDPLPYYAGLLTWAVGAMAEYDPAALYTQTERMRGAHLLLAAALLARRLGETFSTSQGGGTLRLDDDGTVWIGLRRTSELGGQELDLLRCLYERADQLVSRKIVVESVFKEPYIAGNKQMESRINSLVRRLRTKIEPNPNRPRYLYTIKGKGLRLQVEGKPSGKM